MIKETAMTDHEEPTTEAHVHQQRFDGDDPYLVCDCGARWDALSGLPLNVAAIESEARATAPVGLPPGIVDILEQDRVLREALEPFAAFADENGVVPDDFVITQGSAFARRQLTMGDCYRARAALAADSEPVEARATTPAGLDVELLADAIRAAKWYADEADAVIAAGALAAEYDRLAADSEPVEEGA